jgi:S-adenosylmethionine:tRNA ribosyltransferase-isomerase
MKLSEFNYDLPKELIAKYPLKERDKCRLMVLDREKRSITHKAFEDIIGYFSKGDLLVLNDTKVMPARLFGKRKTGGKVELFLLHKNGPVCEALVRPSGRLKEGERIRLESGDEVEVLDRGEAGRRIKFFRAVDDVLKESGHMPLPPYIDRPDEESDKEDYQTVYSRNIGATASPTAGLHFTQELLRGVEARGARIKFVTLHTNYGTFAPIKTEEVESHKMHREYFELSAETIKAVSETRKHDGKVFAVGTTSTRVLEYCASRVIASPAEGGTKQSQKEIASLTSFARNDGSVHGYADMYIYPGYQFKVVDHLITNFHLPKSTLMLLVSAFAGKDFIFEAYHQAIEEKYRFFSYGDAMLIL